MKSDYELGLEPRWFTGKEWANGTAQHELKREYEDAIYRLEPEALKPHAQMWAQMRKAGFKA